MIKKLDKKSENTVIVKLPIITWCFNDDAAKAL
jgi:hypothetical protein